MAATPGSEEVPSTGEGRPELHDGGGVGREQRGGRGEGEENGQKLINEEWREVVERFGRGYVRNLTTFDLDSIGMGMDIRINTGLLSGSLYVIPKIQGVTLTKDNLAKRKWKGGYYFSHPVDSHLGYPPQTGSSDTITVVIATFGPEAGVGSVGMYHLGVFG
uniref:Uncharacterized protein n=1 Tax=Oryza glaberrima TaxID=4538 RepID=I1QT87_ORYGL